MRAIIRALRLSFRDFTIPRSVCLRQRRMPLAECHRIRINEFHNDRRALAGARARARQRRGSLTREIIRRQGQRSILVFRRDLISERNGSWPARIDPPRPARVYFGARKETARGPADSLLRGLQEKHQRDPPRGGVAQYRAARERWRSGPRNFCGLKRHCAAGKEERSAARGHYIGNISAVIPSGCIGSIPRPRSRFLPLLLYPCEFADTWRYIKLLYFVRPSPAAAAAAAAAAPYGAPTPR